MEVPAISPGGFSITFFSDLGSTAKSKTFFPDRRLWIAKSRPNCDAEGLLPELVT